MEEEPVVNIEKACRLCLNNEDGQKMFNIDEEIFEIIWSCGVKIYNNPELPTRVCINCHSILQFIQKFRQMCENSNIYLQEYLQEISQNAAMETQIITKKDPEEIDIIDTLSELDDANEHNEEILNSKDRAQESIIPDVEAPEVLDEEIIQEEQLEEEDDVGAEEYLFEINNVIQEEDNNKEINRDKDTATTDTTEYENDETAEEEELWIEETCNPDDDDQTVYIVDHNNQIQEEMQSKVSLRLEESENNHTAVIHGDKTEKHNTGKPYTCDICGNIFKKFGSYQSHRRRHGNSKPYECEICSAKFDYNFKLERHMRKHTGARPFACEYCDRRFVDRSTMCRHQKIHRDERAYSCDACGKSFNYFSVLKTHIMSHTGEKPYACGICNKGFHRASDLRNHLETLQHRKDPRVPELMKNIRRVDEC